MCLIQSDESLQFSGFISYPTITIHPNSFTFLVGKSGCGKSTYLKLLNRTLAPSRGQILYQGAPIDRYPVLSYRREVLLVPQEIFLLDDTIRENFRFYYDARQEPLPADERISDFLKLCCTEFSPEDSCTSMSGGERQRVFLAIFLSMAQKVLLLDEPTSALDDATAVLLLRQLRDYCQEKGITALCVCHNTYLKDRFADNSIELEVMSHD